MNWLQRIRKCFEIDSVFYTQHAKYEMESEELGRIFEHEVYETICNGEIIEEYLDDVPYPSTLIFGKTKADRPLHILCAYNEEESSVIVITAYHPNPDLWIGYKRRKR